MPFFTKAKKSIAFFFKNTDRILLLLCVLTSVYGFILVYSAAGGSFRGYILQLAAYIVGLLAAIGISQIDYEAICAFWPVWAGISVVLVILTLTPLGLGVGGADDQAWLAIRLGSFQMTLQPAELMKVAFIITFSKHLSMVREEINRPKNLLLLLLHGAVPIGLVTLQGDDGTMLVFFLMLVTMLFIAGVKPLYFLIAGIAGGCVLPFIWDLVIKEKMDRILALIYVEDYLQGAGWQQYQSLISLGSGGLWGKGYMNGGSFFARNNDFILTVAGEEFGFIGALLVLVLLALIIWEIWRCAATARDRLGMFLCVGTMAMIAFQTIINIGMVLRLLPVVGITLPFFSTGGTSVGTLYLAIGLVFSVHFSSRARAHNTIFTKPL